MECFDLNDRNEVNETTDIREKIYLIATFIGVKMKREWSDEYDKWEEEKDRVNEMREWRCECGRTRSLVQFA